jgi:hypothetical protein
MDIKEKLCKEMHQFVKLHIDEVENKVSYSGKRQTYDELGFKNRKDMLSQIKNDWEVAFWAMTELCCWGMKENYVHLFTAYECDDFVVYCIGAKKVRYIKKNFTDYSDDIVEVSPKVKMVKTLVWEAN